jgi:predicted nucleotidyltransferase
MRQDEIIARIRRHAAAIREEGATSLYLFGSAARDEMGPASDIDVFVECDPDRSVSLLHIIGIKHIIEDDLGRRVDITTKESLHPLLKDRILAEAVQVL